MKLWPRSIFSINPVSIVFCTVLVVVILFLTGMPILDMFELKTYDLRFRSRGDLSPLSTVALALIDERSLETEGRWPWPRSKIAKLVELLSRDGAKIIGFDIGFLEPDENSEIKFIDQMACQLDTLRIRDERLADFIGASKKHADNDLALAQAIKNSSATVVLGYFFHMSASDLNYRIDQDKINLQLKRINASKYPLIIYEKGCTGVGPFVKAYAPQSNLDILSDATSRAGYYSVKSDEDGVVRWIPLIIQCGEDLFPPLALSCVWNYLDRPPMLVRVAPYGVEGIQIGHRFIPTDESGQMLINYLGPPKTFPHYCISDILSGKLATGTFKNKIVLVGATAMGTHDLRSTPISPLYPGVEIHATVIDNILTGNFLTKPKWSKIYDLLAIIAMGVLIGIAVPRLSAVKGIAVASALFIAHLATTRYLFLHHRIWLNAVYPLLVLTMTYTYLTMYHYVTEQRERKKIKGTFRQYLPPLVIEEILKSPDRLTLGGEEKVLTVLFSDLEGFTTYSERYTPHEMIEILSGYYDKMTELIFAHWGTLKEYVADELMVIFGAPLEQADHAHRACSTALAMRDRREALRAEWARIGRPYLRARTGINSGPMLVGNLGSSYRFAYGVLGDQVNLGSRLEGLNKMYHTEILIGENTAKLVDGAFQLREIDLVRVKGKLQPVRIYELLERADTRLSAEKEEAYRLYACALKAYWQQSWQDAMKGFQRCLEALPEDGPSRVMTDRCRIYLHRPPSEDWNGVFEHQNK